MEAPQEERLETDHVLVQNQPSTSGITSQSHQGARGKKRQRMDIIDTELWNIIRTTSANMNVAASSESSVRAQSIALRLDKLTPVKRAKARAQIEQMLLHLEFGPDTFNPATSSSSVMPLSFEVDGCYQTL